MATHVSDCRHAVTDVDVTIGVGLDLAITRGVPKSRAKHDNLEEALENVHDSSCTAKGLS